MATIPLVGPSYTSRSVVADCQRTINWYPEAVESGQGKAPAVLYPTPGLAPLTTATGPGTWRGLWAVPPRCFGVVGATLVDVRTPGGLTQPAVSCATLATGLINDGHPVSFADNGIQGHQLLVASGGRVWLYDLQSGAVSQPTLTVSPVVDVAFMDSYFVALSPTALQISQPDDGTTWNGVDVASRSEGADPFVAMLQNHRELWLLGTLTTEVWYDSGDANFPLAPIPGVFINYGCAALASLCHFDQTVAWLAQDRNGDRLAVIAAQYAPQRVSTHAIEAEWRTYARIDDAVSWTYQEAGHSFWVLTFPTASKTWVFDRATNLWHERAFLNPATGAFEAHRASCHAYVQNMHLVGDRASSTLYALSEDQSVDDLPDAPAAAIRRVRRLPHLSQENEAVRFTRLEIELEMGLGTPTGQGVDPQAMLRWSDDRAHTWSSEWWISASPMGTYSRRAQWWRLGRSRDRVFEVSVSDPIPWRLIGGYVTVQRGVGA